MRLLDVLDKINSLKKTPRMGWLEGGVDPSEAEDVAQHSFETSAITLLLSDYLGDKMDTERVLKMAVIHDWAEAVTGDFSRDVSESIGTDTKEDIEENAMEKILDEDLPNRDEYLKLWREYSKKENQESRLVRIADLLSILLEARNLFRRGEDSEKLREIWRTTKEELETYLEYFPELDILVSEFDKEKYP